MHDTELEQRLRATLREEADRLPLRVDVERLQAAVAVRRRASRSNRVGLVAAGVAVVAFGLAAAGLNGFLPAGILPGVAPAIPVPCAPLVVNEPTSLDGGGVQTPPEILLIDAAGTAHRGSLESFRMPGQSMVEVRGRSPDESRLDPRTTSLEIGTAEHTCLWRVELEIRPSRDGASPILNEGGEVLGSEPEDSLSVTAPPPGEWRATVRIAFHTTADAIAISTTTFRLVSTAPETAGASAAPSAPTASPLPAGLTAFEPRSDATILADVPPTWATEPTTKTVELADSTSEAMWIQVSCIDPGITLGTEGDDTDLEVVKVRAGDGLHEVACMPDQPFALAMPLAAGASVTSIEVPDGVAWTALVEAVPVPDTLPTIDIDGPRELEGSSKNPSPDWTLLGGVSIRSVVGTLDEGFSQETVFACLGPGTIKVEFRTPGTTPDQPANSSHGVPCLGQADGFTMAVGARGPHDVVVEADARTAWTIVARSDGVLPPFDAPTIRMTSWAGAAEVDGAGATGVAGCGAAYVVDGASHDDQCGPPGWPDLTGQPVLIARPAGELRVHLEEGWTWDEATLRAAPFLQTGQDEPPVNTWDIPSSVEGNVLVIPLDLSNSRWVIRLDARVSKDDNEYHASLYFVVDVQP